MNGHASPVIGILGGMGPAATADFYRKLVLATPAEHDQDHPRALIWSDPSIPDRASAYLHGHESPVPGLIDGARRLEDAGADFIAVPCNTAHLFLEPVRRCLGIPVLDMIEVTASELAQLRPGSKVALLGTAATVGSGIYRTPLEQRGLRPLDVLPSEQEQVSATIAAVKAGDEARAVRLLSPIVDTVLNRGAETVIGGCTELPLVAEQLASYETFVDPTAALARACVEHVRRDTRSSAHAAEPTNRAAIPSAAAVAL